jgi:phosphoheptose isomerase
MKQEIFEPYIYALENVDPKQIRTVAESISKRIDIGGRIFTIGNGGSHAIAQHLASDLMKAVGDQKTKSCSAMCLTDNVSVFSAISNDIGYDHTFLTQLVFHDLCEKDIIIAFSVSGTSPNILRALHQACLRGALMVVLSGNRLTPGKEHPEWIIGESRYLVVSTGLERNSPNHYYICESVFSCIAHAIANEFHKLRGNYSAEE